MMARLKVVIVGAGPVGSAAALYAAQRGYDVEVYELRPDLRHPGTVPLNFTKSINLVLSERGIHALHQASIPGLADEILATALPLRGRMIHGRKSSGELYEMAQDYDVNGKTIFAVDRKDLNARLLDRLDSMPNVKLFFNHKLTGADFKARKAWLEAKELGVQANGRPKEIEIAFDLMIGADGAHSATRYHMMKFTRMDYQQEYVDTLWCEFHIRPRTGTEAKTLPDKFRISPQHLHIWPAKDFMFIAIPSEDGSFTCTLFMGSKEFTVLEQFPSSIPQFFDKHFPGAGDLIATEDLIESFNTNPHLPLISIKCKPYHCGSSGVIIGDAAHAMVPFYGQGMNAGLEDVRVLFETLDRHDLRAEASYSYEGSSGPSPFFNHAHALAEYSSSRVPDAHAINGLALQNYVEMRASVLSKSYRLRKYLEEFMSVRFPHLGWLTRYSRVSFTNERYAEVIKKTDHQSRVLMRVFWTLLASPCVFVFAGLAYKSRARLMSLLGPLRNLM